ncbi:hypothetical protein PV387_27030 [Streptomyces sp. ME02-6987-2C]|uniref:hypothetical protein n=1 Tax=unclassified Streptomyces TaxID=2593676 RepID=UPI0029B4EC69|nr:MULTISPECIES: hypothetical protein [unclassified Streptomyces]MDX3369634.1 hypothetical protein [Streptomyces sp. ME02-6987-2C]MDX3427045.1 hypothetical protein [Streptomyces sp. ME02-6985-2c]
MGKSPELPTGTALPCLFNALGSKIGYLTSYDIICHESSLPPTALIWTVYGTFAN